jgi:hypothetical protein
MSTDPFAMGGTQDDNAILSLFHDWITAHRDYGAENDPVIWEALVERANDLEMQIYRTPATGPVGLAIKGYFLGYYHADTTLEIADFTTPGSYVEDGELAHWDSRAVKSFFDDAARFVPDLALLIGDLLNAPVRREAQP